jgi:VWFA-related protein
MRRLVWIPVVVISFVAPTLIAQQPTPPAQRATGTVKSDATAILVDVVVRDKRGDPVTDLTAVDFEVEEDGVRQQVGSVTLFSSPDPGASGDAKPASPATPAPGAAAKPPVAPAPPPVIALVFDRLSPEGRALSHKAALGYVAKAEPNSMIGVFGIDLNLKIYQGYTHDPELLKKAIEEIGKRSTSQFDSAAGRADADAFAGGTAAVLRNAQQGAAAGGQASAAAGAAAGAAAPSAMMAEMERRTLETFEVLERDQQGYSTSNSLLALVNSMRALPGRKSVIFFSEGLAIPPAVVAQFRSVIDSANRANVSIYAMDAAGLRTESTSKEARDNINAAAARTLGRNPTSDVVGAAMTQALEKNEDTLRLDPHSGLGELAGDTGGLLIRNTNDLSAGFRRVDEDMRNYYVLTYVPSNDVFDGKFRTIKVNVKRGGVEVASRKGYFAVRAPGALPVKTFEAPALAMLDVTPVPNAFPVRAAAVKFPERDRPGLVPVLVALSASNITFVPSEDKQGQHADFTVLVRFRDQSNEVVRKLSQHYQFDGPADQVETMKQGEVLFYRQTELPPGVYTMETVVFDAVSNRASVRFSTVEQPKAASDGLRVSNLLLVGRSEKVLEADRPADNPFLVGDLLLYPNLGTPLLKAQAKELAFFFTVYQGATKPTAVLELMQNGKLLAQSPLPLDAADADGRIQQVGRLPIDALSPGTYDLRVVVTDGTARQLRSVLVRIAG